MKSALHAIFGTLALATIAFFWTATLVSELFLAPAAVAWVKHVVVGGLLFLVPAMLATVASGFALAQSRCGGLLDRKRRRMPFIAANALLVMIPAALFLDRKAGGGDFDTLFFAVQGIELAVGALQLFLLGLNFRDGLRLARRLPAAKP